VPKAYLVAKPGVAPTPELAAEIFQYMRDREAPYKRIRRLEFTDLPKTISGKIRRVQLRAQEVQRQASGARGEHEFWEEDVAGQR
jgi:acetyl-CoA synthetase